MRILTVTQPWATLLAHGAKRVETRPRRTAYRGPVAIHAAKGFPKAAQALCYRKPFVAALAACEIPSAAALPRGQIIAIGMLEAIVAAGSPECQSLLRTWPDELAFGDFAEGRYGWLLARFVRRLDRPVEHRGQQAFTNLPDHVADTVWNRLVTP